MDEESTILPCSFVFLAVRDRLNIRMRPCLINTYSTMDAIRNRAAKPMKTKRKTSSPELFFFFGGRVELLNTSLVMTLVFKSLFQKRNHLTFALFFVIWKFVRNDPLLYYRRRRRCCCCFCIDPWCGRVCRCLSICSNVESVTKEFKFSIDIQLPLSPALDVRSFSEEDFFCVGNGSSFCRAVRSEKENFFSSLLVFMEKILSRFFLASLESISLDLTWCLNDLLRAIWNYNNGAGWSCWLQIVRILVV